MMSGLPIPAVRLVGLSLAVLALAAAPARADVTATVKVSVQVYGRTALQVSGQQLTWELPFDAASASAVIDFTAKARTRRDGEVVLTVEPERWLDGPGGAADADALVTFDGRGPGTLAGQLVPASPSIVGRWIGSGRRTGQLSFALHAGVAGSYRLPVRLVLSTP